MNNIQNTGSLPARPETETANIMNEAQDEAGFEKMLKFNKGEYLCDGQLIQLGSKMTAHVVGWTKVWVKFKDKKFIERRIFRVARGDKIPDRTMLDERDERQWAPGFDGRPKDPWVFQYLIPMEDPETDEVRIFVTSSVGGRRAVADLCTAYARRAQRQANCGQPKIKLQIKHMPTANFGKVARPHFEIVGWDDSSLNVREVPDNIMGDGKTTAEFNDDIPF